MLSIHDLGGKFVGNADSSPASAPGSNEHAYAQQITISRLGLGSLEGRDFYKLHKEVEAGDYVVGRYEAQFGIRVIHIYPQEGFFPNGWRLSRCEGQVCRLASTTTTQAVVSPKRANGRRHRRLLLRPDQDISSGVRFGKTTHGQKDLMKSQEMPHFDAGSGQKANSHPPSAGEMMPEITLPSIQGGSVRTSDYRGRRNLVLAFCGDGKSDATRSFLQRVSQQHAQFEYEEAEVLAVVREESLPDYFGGLSFPVLKDAQGHAHQSAGFQPAEALAAPLVFVVDRFGEIRYVFHPRDTADVAVAAALEWVGYINLECPE